jgi:excisionase family DNA binding protein
MEEKLYNVKEVSEYLNVPVSWVYNRAKNHGLPCIKLGKYIRFNIKEVEEYFEEGRDKKA